MKKLLAAIGVTLTSFGSAQAIEVDMAAAVAALQHPDTLLIDVRTPEEYAAGALNGALNLPHEQVGPGISALTSDKDRMIVLYCRSGRRSDIASSTLASLGYQNVINGGAYEALQQRLPE